MPILLKNMVNVKQQNGGSQKIGSLPFYLCSPLEIPRLGMTGNGSSMPTATDEERANIVYFPAANLT